MLGRPTPLLERLEDHPEVVPVVVETRRRDRQHLGDPRAGAPHHIQYKAVHGVGLGLQQRQHLALEQVRGHGVEGLPGATAACREAQNSRYGFEKPKTLPGSGGPS